VPITIRHLWFHQRRLKICGRPPGPPLLGDKKGSLSDTLRLPAEGQRPSAHPGGLVQGRVSTGPLQSTRRSPGRSFSCTSSDTNIPEKRWLSGPRPDLPIERTTVRWVNYPTATKSCGGSSLAGRPPSTLGRALPFSRQCVSNRRALSPCTASTQSQTFDADYPRLQTLEIPGRRTIKKWGWGIDRG
jgi:hypothetical protein